MIDPYPYTDADLDMDSYLDIVVPVEMDCSTSTADPNQYSSSAGRVYHPDLLEVEAPPTPDGGGGTT